MSASLRGGCTGGKSPSNYGNPWIKGKTGRFCPYCGRSIRDYYKQDKCPWGECQRILFHPLPEPPTGFIWCGGWKLSCVPVSACFCQLCRWMTPHGRQWQQIVLAGRRRIAVEQKKIEQELLDLQGIPQPQTRDVQKSKVNDSPVPPFLDMEIDKLLADDEDMQTGNANTPAQGTDPTGLLSAAEQDDN